MNSLLQVIIGQMLIIDSKVVQISIKLVRDLWEAHQLPLCPTLQESELLCHQQKILVSNLTILTMNGELLVSCLKAKDYMY